MSDRAALGGIFALASATNYGLNTPFARLAHLNGIAPALAVPCRAGVLLAVATLYLMLTGGRFAVARRAWPSLAVLAGATTTVSIAYLGSVAFIPVSVSAIILFTFPIQILVWSIAKGRERASGGGIAIFAVAFAGLVLVIGPQADELDWHGIALAATASAAATLQFLSGARVSVHCPPTTAIFWVHLAVLPISTVVAVVLRTAIPAWSLDLWWPVIALSATYVGAFVLQLLALRIVPPARVGLFFNLEPVVTVAAAALVLGEMLSGPQYAGAALVIGALAAARARGRANASGASG